MGEKRKMIKVTYEYDDGETVVLEGERLERWNKLVDSGLFLLWSHNMIKEEDKDLFWIEMPKDIGEKLENSEIDKSLKKLERKIEKFKREKG